ncbi:unnamed protein product [Rotaria sordida]|uniref:Uncharacterized protein n=1 Tax=Rotaria sordida TaxID=392033 RepID=A0A814K4G4_9BILA|nr:unnamed protein product [Rotaria sordida]CAF3649862.1 unnamed protein product [Rotaria sordida]
MTSSSLVCSIDGCKRPITCLCHHCQKNLCSKHFNEHQIQVNNELIPMTDCLNELKMRLQIDEKTGPLAMLQMWRHKKYNEIDQEYNLEVEKLKKKISKYDEQISETVSNIQELINEGDASIDQVKEIQKIIEIITDQVNNLTMSESIEIINEQNLLGTYIRMGSIQYLVKAKIKCNNIDLYGLESERSLVGYDGLCPQCGKAHVLFERNRGFYALCQTLHTQIFFFSFMDIVLQQQPTYLTPTQCARQFADDLLENKDIAISMSHMMSPSYLISLINIAEMYLTYERSLFLSTVAEIGLLCSNKYYERVHYFISFLDELIEFHNDIKYKILIEKYLNRIVYADLTDHFISYPIILQIQIMAIIESTPILHFPLIRDGSESDQSKIDLFLQDAARYFHNISSRSLYRRIVFRLNSQICSQQSILRALIIGCIFLPLTCHAAFLDELYNLLSKQPILLSLTNMETFFHVLWPTGINQSYSVPRVYLSQLLIVRLNNIQKYFAQIIQICFLIHLRVPNIRVNLMDIIEPLCETKGFQQYLDQQQQEFNLSRQDDQQNVSILEPILCQVRERMKRGFRLKQLCRMKIRSHLAKNTNSYILTQVNQLKELSDTNKTYLTYNLELLLNDPEKFFDSTQPQNEPIWNSSIPPPPVN